MSKTLTEMQIRAAAKQHQVDYPALRAVCQVESGGDGYLADGRIKILLERHVLWKRLKTRNINPRTLAEDRPDLCGPARNPKAYPYGTSEHQHDRVLAVIEWAQAHDAEHWESYKKSAYEACSWGLFQQMGFHYQAAGYANVYAFKHALEESEENQLTAILKWMTGNSLLQRLRAHDWDRFVTGYNGAGQVAYYKGKLLAAYRQFGGK
jgi:hypothetical protein